MTDLTLYEPADLAPALDQVRQLVEATTPTNTRRASAADWAHFSTWCAAQRYSPC